MKRWIYSARAMRFHALKESPKTTSHRMALRWYRGLKRRYPSARGWVHEIQAVSK